MNAVQSVQVVQPLSFDSLRGAQDKRSVQRLRLFNVQVQKFNEKSLRGKFHVSGIPETSKRSNKQN
jgi:hypothetical protein